MSKYIIFVTDDFGMTHSVNKGIEHAMTKGVVTATNFMVPTPWFEEALKIAESNNLPVGIHLNMTCEWENYRWRPLSSGKSISDSDGTFFRSYKELIKHGELREIADEYRAQIDYLISRNWNITHIDSHMLPPVFNCEEAEIKVAKIVEDIAREYNLIYLYGCENGKSSYFDSYYEKSGNSEDHLYEYLDTLNDGFHLVVTHCALESEEQLNLTMEDSLPYQWALEYRKADLDTLTSDKLRTYLNKNNFEMISVPRLLELKGIN